MRKTLFIKNAVILAATGVILRLAGILFKVKAAAALGGEGLGIYHLALSVFILCEGTVTSGISVAVTRLTASDLQNRATDILHDGIFIGEIVSALFFVIIFGFSRTVSLYLFGNESYAFVIKVFCFNLPLCAVSAVFKGYFIGKQNALPASIASICEQAVRLLIAFIFIEGAAAYGIAHGAALVFISGAVGEAVCVLILICFYKNDIKKLPCNGKCISSKREILRIGFPISASRFSNSLLRTFENALIPIRLSLFSGAENAMSSFGVLKGMALPILLFPCTLLNALSALLIPEMTRALKGKKPFVIKASVNKCLKITLLVGGLSALMFFCLGDFLGNLIYNNNEAALYIRLLSPIVPLMYLDGVADGLLKGLDCQKTLFKNYVADSILRIVLIYFFLSEYGMSAFVIIMYISNTLTCGLNLKKLLEFCRIK